MARVAINTGASANDGTGDNLRSAGGILNNNFLELYTYLGAGSTTILSAPLWSSTNVGINTLSNVGIGTTNPRFTLEVGAVGASGTTLFVNGDARVTGIVTIGPASITLNGITNTVNVGTGITLNGSTGIISATAIILGGTTLTGAAVTFITAGSGISVDQGTGNVTITATGGGGGGGESYWVETSAGIHTLSNVGVGTTNPTSALTVSGDVSASSLRGYNALVGTASSTITSFTVLSVTKTSNHRYFGTGSAIGYHIDGVEAPFLTLLPGKTYRFNQSDGSNNTHQLRFYYQADKTTEFTTNVTTNGTAGSAGAYTQIVVTDTTPIVLHYQCINHGYMGNAAQFNSNVVDTPYQITARSGINVTGVVTATTFSGSGSGLTNISSNQLSGALPALDGSALIGLVGVGTGVEIQENGSPVGTAVTINFGTNLDVSFAGGVATVDATSGGGSSQFVTTAAGIHTLSNVGIGTTNPTSKLTVSGDVLVSDKIVAGLTSSIIPFYWENFSDLPSFSTYHGAFAHVHQTGKAYYAHTRWIELVHTEASGVVGTGTERYNVGVVTASSLRGYSALVGTASSSTTSFTVTVVSKSANHRYFGTGSALGYHIDGIESPFLILLPGKVYRFTQDDASNSTHQLLFYYEANRTTQYTTNVTTNGSAGSAGSYTQIVVTDTTPVVLHYQCINHGYMGNAANFSSNVVDTPYQITARSGINVTGVVTASSFVGSLTGTATSTTNIPNLTGDITSTGTTTAIAAGVIVNADINASAGIVDTKLDTISTAGKVSNSATTATSANTNSAIVARDGSGNFTAGTITATTFSGSGSGLTGLPDFTIIFTISATGSADYIFSGPGIVSGNTNDPVLYLYKGFTYTFINTTGGSHPFAIRESNGGASYTPGVSGSTTGTQTFIVPMNAPSTLYYQCTIHSGMGNVINIV